MATYAIIGSTGNCGAALLRKLLESSQIEIRAYCRNRSKLDRLIPQIIDNDKVKVFEGSIQDVDLITDCVRGTKAVFLVVTSNDNIPGCRLSQDSAVTVISALQKIRMEEGGGVKLPRLVMLSSHTFEDHLTRDMPKLFRALMLTVGSNVYADLQKSEALLRSHNDLVATTFIKPAGLSQDIARGHKLSLDESESFLSYADLAASMVEAADDESGQYEGKNVGVVNFKRGEGAKFPSGGPKTIALGVTRHFLPWLHPYLPMAGAA